MNQMLRETTARDEFVPARRADEGTPGPLSEKSPVVQSERQMLDHQAEAHWSDDGGQRDRSALAPSGPMPVIVPNPRATNSPTGMPVPRSEIRLNWIPIFWVGLIHAGALFAPFTINWSALVVCLILYVLTSIGVNVGFHRLLTHRSFQTPKPVEYLLTVLGSVAGQGGVLQWVATHRAHHAHADEEGDPHSPRDGAWWAHMLWWMPFDRVLDVAAQRVRYVRDLAKDPMHRLLDHCQVPLTLGLAAMLFVLGEAWGGVGLSWLVWGIFVRMTLTYHVTWLVNSATHMWGYRSYETKDRSTNLWWVALLTFGEGWHNNHHAFPRSARHGLRWWELDISYWTIRLMALVRLARHVQMPHEPSMK